ncbi:hypothetical protein J6590_070452 [Homalodisca vitripennis]|nr:hypothetical protein J6590_070452 [Homalodisca vitripennis]
MCILLLVAFALGAAVLPSATIRIEDGPSVETTDAASESITRSPNFNSSINVNINHPSIRVPVNSLKNTDNSSQNLLHASGPSSLPTAPEDRQLYDNTYQYYFQVWYLPMFFAVYFMLYVGALIIKGAARHKVKFPLIPAQSARGDPDWNLDLDLLTERVTRAVSDAALRYIRRRVIDHN